jgi:HPt (histidine-containing phosphotransfer) domain-containing protein
VADRAERPLVSRFAGDPEMGEIVARFCRALPERIAAISSAVDRGAREDARRLSHHLKGSGGGYGYPEISAAAGHLESALRAGDDVSTSEALASLVAVCGRVRG